MQQRIAEILGKELKSQQIQKYFPKKPIPPKMKSNDKDKNTTNKTSTNKSIPQTTIKTDTKKKRFRRHKGRREIHQIDTIEQVQKDLGNQAAEEVNNIITNEQVKYINNPRFNGGLHFNNSIIITDNNKAYKAITLMDSGSGRNIIDKELLQKINVQPYSNRQSAIQSGQTVVGIEESCLLNVLVDFKPRQYYLTKIKFDVIDIKRPNTKFYKEK